MSDEKLNITPPPNWVPEIVYEDADDGMSSQLPFIHVPAGQDMPSLLFIFESRETGECEPGLSGEEVPVTELDLYQYANMNTLKKKLSWVEYDNVRFALGLEPMRTAAVKGAKITSNIKIALEDGTDALDNEQGTRDEKGFTVSKDGMKPSE